MRLFKEKAYNQDSFKRLIHCLSRMSEDELNKVEQLLDVVFSSTGQIISECKSNSKVIPKVETLDETITEAQNKLNVEQLEK